mgnify:FL=1
MKTTDVMTKKEILKYLIDRYEQNKLMNNYINNQLKTNLN